MPPLPWNAPGPPPRRLVVVANPGSRRLVLLDQALASLGRPPARVVAYLDLLAGRTRLDELVQPGDAVRLETPGQDFAVEQALLAAGADEPDQPDPGAPAPARLSRREVAALEPDRGRILAPRQWYLGFRAALRRLAGHLQAAPDHRLLTPPAEVEVLFDKDRTQDRFAARGLPIPPALGPVRSYEELRLRLREGRMGRAFVKLRHGSSASGVVAYAMQGSHEQAVTTVELVSAGGRLLLFNSRRLRTYRRRDEIAGLIDAVAREGVRVERWLPKAGLEGRACDLRVLVIAGRPRHAVVRLSEGPLTNLHLKNARADPDALRARLAEGAWNELLETCRHAAGAFPDSLQVGLDVLVRADYRRHALLEANAFGDLLPGARHEGDDAYTAQLRALGFAEGPALSAVQDKA